MHVLYFHQHFSTPDGSDGTRSYEISKCLLASGHRVTMVCGAGALCKSGLSGPFLSGRREGSVDSIYVIELELPYSNYDGFLRRCWTFLRFALCSAILTLRLDYDVVYATSTPLTVALPGIAARWLRRKPFVFEVRDLWPELPRAMGVITNPLVLLMMDWLELVAYHSAIPALHFHPESHRASLDAAFLESRVVTAPNGCDMDLFTRTRQSCYLKSPVCRQTGLWRRLPALTVLPMVWTPSWTQRQNCGCAGASISILCLSVTGRKTYSYRTGTPR